MPPDYIAANREKLAAAVARCRPTLSACAIARGHTAGGDTAGIPLVVFFGWPLLALFGRAVATGDRRGSSNSCNVPGPNLLAFTHGAGGGQQL